MLLILASLVAAHAAPIDDYAARPGWACSYGKAIQTCGGMELFGDVEAQHTVKLCGEAQAVCEQTWRLTAPEDTLLAALPRWAAAIEDEVTASGWRIALAPTPQAWLAKRWSAEHIASVEVGPDYLVARILPRALCDKRTVIRDLDALVLPLADAGIAETWPEVAHTRVEHLDDRVLDTIRERSTEPLAEETHHRRSLIGSDQLQCYLELNNRRDVMEGTRELFMDWVQWRNPTPVELRQRKKEEKQMAREEAARKKRDVQGNDLEAVPEEHEREEVDENDWHEIE